MQTILKKAGTKVAYPDNPEEGWDEVVYADNPEKIYGTK